MSINKDASLIATASDKGTMVRLFDFNTLQMLKELRRGIDRADIFSISFSINSDWLACSSDKGTVHIFSLNQ